MEIIKSKLFRYFFIVLTLVTCFLFSKNTYASELITHETNDSYSQGYNLNGICMSAGLAKIQFNSTGYTQLNNIAFQLVALRSTDKVCPTVLLYDSNQTTLLDQSSDCQIGNMRDCGGGTCYNANRDEIAFYFDYTMQPNHSYYVDICSVTGRVHNIDYSNTTYKTTYWIYGDYNNAISSVAPVQGGTYKNFDFWQTQITLNPSNTYPSYVIQVQYATSSTFNISTTDISNFYPVSNYTAWSFPKSEFLNNNHYYTIFRLFDNEANELASSSIDFYIDNINGSSTFPILNGTSTVSDCLNDTWCKLYVKLIYPSSDSTNALKNEFESIKNTIPISYFTQASSTLHQINMSTTTQSLTNTDLIQKMANPFKVITGYIFSFMFLIYLFIRTKHFFR